MSLSTSSSSLIKRFRRRVFWMAKRLDLHPWLDRIRHTTWPFRDRYTVEDNTLVTIFTAHPELFPRFQPVRSTSEPPRQRVTVSLIMTARNECDTVRGTIGCLLSQTRLPDEIVITETGSTDSTLELLREMAAESPVPIHILVEDDANIARGRNIAIKKARGPVIAVTDFGCQPNPGWLANLVAPFEIDPQNQVTAGRYQVAASPDQTGRFPFWPGLDQIDPQSYLPPGGSLAFTKQAWESVGGFPEWLTLTGEDTYFDLELKRSTCQWSFAPEAVVSWQPPHTFRGWWRKAGYWASGDGEIGANARAYQRALRQIGFLFLLPLALSLLGVIAVLAQSSPLLLVSVGLLFLWLGRFYSRTRKVGYSPVLELGVRIAMIHGYLRGVHRRTKVDAKRWKSVRGIMVILSGVPVDDTGGGARGTQIALELIRRQFLVFFVHRFPKYESARIEVQIHHPNLLTAPFKKFSLEDFLEHFEDLLHEKPAGVLVEHPIPDFLPVVRELRQQKMRVIYDLIDDWTTSLGARWYTLKAELALLSEADALIATAPSLKTRLENMSGRKALLLPNAVNRYLFNPHRAYPRPSDLPAAAWTVMYIGALWGEWFDWKLLIEIACRYPDASVVVIGEYRGQCLEKLPNLHFMGLKPQRDLPAYLAYANVAIIPWKVNDITRATSPLKVYEYLAMHKPVVAPDLPLLSGLPYVFLSKDNDDFLLQVDAAREVKVDEDALESFLSNNTWWARVGSIIDIIQNQE